LESCAPPQMPSERAGAATSCRGTRAHVRGQHRESGATRRRSVHGSRTTTWLYGCRDGLHQGCRTCCAPKPSSIGSTSAMGNHGTKVRGEKATGRSKKVEEGRRKSKRVEEGRRSKKVVEGRRRLERVEEADHVRRWRSDPIRPRCKASTRPPQTGSPCSTVGRREYSSACSSLARLAILLRALLRMCSSQSL